MVWLKIDVIDLENILTGVGKVLQNKVDVGYAEFVAGYLVDSIEELETEYPTHTLIGLLRAAHSAVMGAAVWEGSELRQLYAV